MARATMGPGRMVASTVDDTTEPDDDAVVTYVTRPVRVFTAADPYNVEVIPRIVHVLTSDEVAYPIRPDAWDLERIEAFAQSCVSEGKTLRDLRESLAQEG